jgi:hypothetical protein
MAWRSGEQTLRAYEHLERSDSFQRRLRAIHQTMQRRERLAARPTASRRTVRSDDESVTHADTVWVDRLVFD